MWKIIDNRTNRLLLQCSCCAIGVVAFVASLGLFRNDYQDNWYVFFTNLSNYYCMVMVFYEEGKISVKHILSCLIFPLIYVSFIMIRAPFIKLDPNNPDIKKYPYFFLDIETLGTSGFIK